MNCLEDKEAFAEASKGTPPRRQGSFSALQDWAEVRRAAWGTGQGLCVGKRQSVQARVSLHVLAENATLQS